MGIKEDLDSLIQSNRRGNLEEKSCAAHITLERFEQVEEAIIRNKGVQSFSSYGFVPSALRKLIQRYCDNSLNKEDTLQGVRAMKEEAKTYLISRGFSPHLAQGAEEFEDKMASETHKQRMRKLDETIKQIRDLGSKIKKSKYRN